MESWFDWSYPAGIFDSIDWLVQITRWRTDTADHQSVCVAAKRILENEKTIQPSETGLWNARVVRPTHFEDSSDLGLAVRYVSDLSFTITGAQSAYDIPQGQKTAVDMNGLFEAIAYVTGSVDSFGAGQVDEMELGAKVVRVVGRVGQLVSHGAVTHSFGRIRPSLLDGDGEDWMRSAGLFVHLSAARVTKQCTSIEASHDLLKGCTSYLVGSIDDWRKFRSDYFQVKIQISCELAWNLLVFPDSSSLIWSSFSAGSSKSLSSSL